MKKLILYARKSMNRADRQVQSIDGQINEMPTIHPSRTCAVKARFFKKMKK